jgi:transcription antitermination factor NusG
MKKKWYAIFTKPKCEAKVTTQLSKNKIEYYCPPNSKRNSWTMYHRGSFEPLFPSCVFVHLREYEVPKVLRISSVINFLYWLNQPALIQDVEINMMQKFLSEHAAIQVERCELNMNKLPEIIVEPFFRQDTEMITLKHKVVRLLLPSLGYTLVAIAEIANVAATVFVKQEEKNQPLQTIYKHAF